MAVRADPEPGDSGSRPARIGYHRSSTLLARLRVNSVKRMASGWHLAARWVRTERPDAGGGHTTCRQSPANSGLLAGQTLVKCSSNAGRMPLRESEGIRASCEQHTRSAGSSGMAAVHGIYPPATRPLHVQFAQSQRRHSPAVPQPVSLPPQQRPRHPPPRRRRPRRRRPVAPPRPPAPPRPSPRRRRQQRRPGEGSLGRAISGGVGRCGPGGQTGVKPQTCDQEGQMMVGRCSNADMLIH